MAADPRRSSAQADFWNPTGPGTSTVAAVRGIAQGINPQVRGWINYYGAFYRSMLYSLAGRIDEHLVRWAMQKFKRLRGRATRAWRWLDTVRRRQPTLFAHWYLLPSTPRRTVGAV